MATSRKSRTVQCNRWISIYFLFCRNTYCYYRVLSRKGGNGVLLFYSNLQSWIKPRYSFNWRGLCIISPDAVGAGSGSTGEFIKQLYSAFLLLLGIWANSLCSAPSCQQFLETLTILLTMQIYIYKLYYFVHFILWVVHVLPIHFLCIKCYFSSDLFDILASSIFVFTEKHVNNFIYWCCTMCLLVIQVAVEYIPQPLLDLFKW